MKTPDFTVLMPVYNAGRFLRRAVRDVLRQTFRDFELLVVDDGSTDDSTRIIQEFRDPRIRLLPLDANRGLVSALNAGLAEARGRWIARQDADDRCRPDRLEKQRRVLQENPEAVLVYSRARLIDEHGWWRGVLRPPVDDAALRWDLCFRNAVPHTSVVFPVELVRDRLAGYRGDNVTADYHLWSRLLCEGNAYGQPWQLVSYRNHASSIMGQDRQASSEPRLSELARIRRDNLRTWLYATDEEADVVGAAWTHAGNAKWDRYFEVTDQLLSRVTSCRLRVDRNLLSEQDYTLLHLARASGVECGQVFLETMKKKSPQRHAALPLFRTFLTRLT